MSLPCALIVGSTGVGKASLTAKLCPFFKPDQAGQTAIWHISNKYYDADVGLITSHPEAQQSQATAASGRVEAVVILHDCTTHDSFVATRDWAEGPGAELVEHAAICLCIANKVLKCCTYPASKSNQQLFPWSQRLCACS